MPIPDQQAGRRSFGPRAVFFVWLCVACGCQGGDREGGSEQGTDSDSSTATLLGTDSHVCEEQELTIEPVPVSLMILLDLSGSMSQGSPSKIYQAQQALTQLLGDWAWAGISFGFDVFPKSSICEVWGPVVHDCAVGNEGVITEAVGSAIADGATPLLCAMENYISFSYAPGCFDDGEIEKYMLIVADGCDTCGEQCIYAGMDYTEPALFVGITSELLNLGIRTFVIGFGAELSGNSCANQLKVIVQNGGTDLENYIEAVDQAGLHAALQNIVRELVSCEVALEDVSAIADPDKVNFYFNEEAVPYDEGCAQAQGWTWTDQTHTAVEFCQEACGYLKSGQVSALSAAFGCPPPLVN